VSPKKIEERKGSMPDDPFFRRFLRDEESKQRRIST
jgi:hypothetical protein